jgi:MFS family permease
VIDLSGRISMATPAAVDNPSDAGATLSGIRPLMFSTAVSVIGQGAFAVACPLLIASVTSDPLAVSLATVCLYVPWILVGLPAGALVDRLPRRTVMIAADAGRVAAIAALGLATAIDHRPPVWLILAVILLTTTGQSFFDSSAQATIPAVLGQDKPLLEASRPRRSCSTPPRSSGSRPPGTAH